MGSERIVIPKAWRSEVQSLLAFFVLCVVSSALSRFYPGSVFHGKLFSVFGLALNASLPLFWLIPMATLGMIIVRIYDVHYVVDARGIEARVGILGLHQRSTRVRYEDIRSLEIEQSLMGRFLDFGDLEIATSGTEGVEMVLCGIATPREVLEMIQGERDKRDRLSKKSFMRTDPQQQQRATV